MNERAVCRLVLAGGLVAQAFAAAAGQFDARIPMVIGNAATYYVEGRFGGLEATEFLVDTGSGFLAINGPMRDRLLAAGLATYRRDLRGVLADGREMDVPVYRVARFSLGPCTLEDVEAVVLPSTELQILGLNVLNRSAPFIFSVDPPELVLSHCTGPVPANTEVTASAD